VTGVSRQLIAIKTIADVRKMREYQEPKSPVPVCLLHTHHITPTSKRPTLDELESTQYRRFDILNKWRSIWNTR